MNNIPKAKKVNKVTEDISKEQNIQEKVDKFKKELTDVFMSNLTDKTRRLLVKELIEQYAWVSVSMKELSEKINGRDYIEKYQNSETQWGVRKSAYVETYNELAKTLVKVNKELVSTLPKGSMATDMLDTFNNKYKEDD